MAKSDLEKLVTAIGSVAEAIALFYTSLVMNGVPSETAETMANHFLDGLLSGIR